MTPELKKARRVLARAKLRLHLLNSASWVFIHDSDSCTLEATRMARDLARQIKAHELECRRLALTGPYTVRQYGLQWMVYEKEECLFPYGKTRKRQAIYWAERQNRKAGK